MQQSRVDRIANEPLRLLALNGNAAVVEASHNRSLLALLHRLGGRLHSKAMLKVGNEHILLCLLRADRVEERFSGVRKQFARAASENEDDACGKKTFEKISLLSILKH